MVHGQHMSNPSKHAGCVCPCWVFDWDPTPSQHSSQSAMLRGVLSPEDLVDRAVPCPATVASRNISQLGFLWTIVRRSFEEANALKVPIFEVEPCVNTFWRDPWAWTAWQQPSTSLKCSHAKFSRELGQHTHLFPQDGFYEPACAINSCLYIFFVHIYVYVFIYDSSLPLWLTFLQQKWLSKDPAALSIATFAFSSLELEETSLISVGKTLLAAKLLESIWAVFVDKLSSKLCFE